MATPLGAALLGTGIFPRDIYKSSFKANAATVELRAVWSRTLASAEAFAQEFFPDSTPLAGEEGLQSILDDPAIDLVVVVLPVQAALQVVERCIAAGKSVVQEKPVAGTAAEGAAAIARYRAAVSAAEAGGSLRRAPLWMFAENYRWEAVFVAAASRVSALGRIVKLDLIADLPMDERNKYFSSTWRRDTSLCPGGFFMDSSVHFIGALRMLALAAGTGEAVSASAHAVQAKPDLSFPDSVVGVAVTASGVPACISISLAAHQVRWSLSVVGTAGTLEVSRGGWSGSRGEYTLHMKTVEPIEGAPEDQADPTFLQQRFGFSGCADEFVEFVGTARELRAGAGAVPGPDARSAPEQGFRDLALIEALLASAAAGGQAVAVAQV